MARGDRLYFKTWIELVLDDPAFVLLSSDEKAIYLYCRAVAVRERTERPVALRSAEHVARQVGIRRRPVLELDGTLKRADGNRVVFEEISEVVEKAFRKMSAKPHKLLAVRELKDGTWSVKVCGVRDEHAKLRGWKGDP